MAELVAELAILVYIAGAVANGSSVEARVAEACSNSDKPAVHASAGRSRGLAAESY